MKHINDLTTQRPDESGKTSVVSRSSGDARARTDNREARQKIQALWGMMSSMFGHKWVSSYGAEVDPDRVWQAALDGVTPDQIREGLRRIRERGDDWPPSAPEFRQLCLHPPATEFALAQQRATQIADKRRADERRKRLENKPDPEAISKARDGFWASIGRGA